MPHRTGRRHLPPYVKVATDPNGLEQYLVTSGYQSAPTRLRILRPARPRIGSQRKLLFILPVVAGARADYGDRLAEVRRLGMQEDSRYVIVAPDFAKVPWYGNHPTDPGRQDESYVIEELLPLVDHLVPEAGPRLLLGFSKSGWGALSLLLRHPRLFDTAFVWDAPLAEDAPDRFGMDEAFGTRRNFEEYRIAALLKRHAGQFSGPRARIHLLGSAYFTDSMRTAHLLMGELGIAHTYRETGAMEHNWHSGWMARVAEVLRH